MCSVWVDPANERGTYKQHESKKLSLHKRRHKVVLSRDVQQLTKVCIVIFFVHSVATRTNTGTQTKTATRTNKATRTKKQVTTAKKQQTNKRGRPQVPFEEASEKTKKRRIAAIEKSLEGKQLLCTTNF
jgi:hypothetical protein